MSQETRVFELSPLGAPRLREALHEALPQAQWRTVPHALFSLKHEDVVLTFYKSGKVVLQGSQLDDFAARFLGKTAASASAAPRMPLVEATIGSDEVGKGDYFGPLVVAAVFAEPEHATWLAELGVADSKTLSDRRMQAQAGFLEQRLDHEVVVLEPSAYNVRHAATGNLNRLLADLHAQAITPLLRRHAGVERVLVDRFADERILIDALGKRGLHVPQLVQVPRAEASPVVAAASILARAHFLDGLKRCEEECGTELHKGAGSPVDEAAQRVVAIGGRALLSRVAKLHFKNTQRIAGI